MFVKICRKVASIKLIVSLLSFYILAQRRDATNERSVAVNYTVTGADVF